jgi:BirA family biotin operon repressor/biotin-[acetyl-CoA-carboxylase] ligase
VLVTASRQHTGRGRSGGPWWQAPRAVAASLAFRPGWDDGALPVLALVAGLAARDALAGAVDLAWPNDLVTPAGKAGGILLEASDGVVVAGLGVNLWWPDPPPETAAIHPDDPGAGPVRSVAEAWAASLLQRAAAGSESWGRDEYRAACVTLGREITWEPGGRGRAGDVGEDGALLVSTAAGAVQLHSGRVNTIRPT